MSGADLIFLPWVRRGAAAGMQRPDTFGEGQPGLATATVTLAINAAPGASVPVTVMGPGHVTGLDQRQVVRTNPAPGSRSFEPNYFPLIEFDEPSLPWLFTPAAAGAQARLRPWLCLVVVRVQNGVRLDPPRLTPLRVLRIGRPANAADELPDLADSWAWAHAQLTAPPNAGEADLRAQLVANPERSVARLLASRVLRSETDYIACVVPTFELGRKAGLGLEITGGDEEKLAPAWQPGQAEAELPVYYAWEFATGAGGDFQSLAMLLTAGPLPDGVGVKTIDVSESGLFVDLPPETTLSLSGALRPLDAPVRDWPSPALKAAWETALAPVLNAPAEVHDDEDPIVAPPLYGAAQAGLARLDPAQPERWFEQLNLAPEYRAIAGLGTRVVRGHQDALMASAWAQAAEIEKVNQRLRQTELGCLVATRMHVRHIAPLDPAVALQVMSPMQARMVRAGSDLRTSLIATGLEPRAFSTTLRRIARPRGAINRRVQRASTTPSPPRIVSLLPSLQPTLVMARMVVRPAGPVTLERVASSLSPPRTDISWSEATAEGVTQAPRRPFFAFVPLGHRVPMEPTDFAPATPGIRPGTVLGPQVLSRPEARRRPGFPDIPDLPDEPEPPDDPPPPRPPRPVDNAAATLFRTTAAAHLARFCLPRVIASHPPLRGGPLQPARDLVFARTTPRETFAARVRATVALPGPARPDTAVFTPVGLSPTFPQPMIEPLAEIAQELVLPGLDLVPANTVVPLETNSAFVEAYLVGLNTEMGRELVWRGFPVNLRATYFDRFWDAAPDAEHRHPDIHIISSWGDLPLGEAAQTNEAFVMLIRSELLRRYPNAVIYATRPGAPAEERQPIFTGGFEPDVRYIGFDIPSGEIDGWSFVLQEHPSAPRFGIEVGDDTGGGSHVLPPAANAALVAQATRQMPVRITLPSSVLLGGG